MVETGTITNAEPIGAFAYTRWHTQQLAKQRAAASAASAAAGPVVSPSPEMRRAIVTDEIVVLTKRGYRIVSQTDD